MTRVWKLSPGHLHLCQVVGRAVHVIVVMGCSRSVHHPFLPLCLGTALTGFGRAKNSVAGLSSSSRTSLCWCSSECIKGVIVISNLQSLAVSVRTDSCTWLGLTGGEVLFVKAGKGTGQDLGSSTEHQQRQQELAWAQLFEKWLDWRSGQTQDWDCVKFEKG